MLSIFLTSGVISAISPLVSYLYYDFVYKPIVDKWNNEGINSGYRHEELSTYYENINYIFLGMLIPGISLLFIVWIYSIIDGIITTKHLDKILNKALLLKNSGIKFSFEIRNKIL